MRASARPPSLLLALGLCALAHGLGCGDKSEEDPGGQCAALCENGCQAYAACGLDVEASCASDCTERLKGTDCRAAPPLDRMTCPELEEQLKCANHCITLCQRAAECATFDSELCELGCTALEPLVCNAASVAPRSCDQIKVEARDYEPAGRAVRAGKGGSIMDIFRTPLSYGPSPTGLCKDANSCAPPLGCSQETNTCDVCTSDAECQVPILHRACLAEGRCAQVGCLKDQDCVLSSCDLGTHSCRPLF